MDESVYIIKLSAQDVQGRRLVNGLYCSVLGGKGRRDIPPTTGDQVSAEDFFDEVDKELFVISFAED